MTVMKIEVSKKPISNRTTPFYIWVIYDVKMRSLMKRKYSNYPYLHRRSAKSGLTTPLWNETLLDYGK